MRREPFTMPVAVAMAILSAANPAAALPMAMWSFDASVGISATLVRGHHGRPGIGHRPGRPGHGIHHRPGGHPGWNTGRHGWHGHHHHWQGGYHGGWRRPYRWSPGGAIAAGAAIGFMSAAAAAAVASSAAPAAGLCWYYTDASQRAGFWDNCPR